MKDIPPVPAIAGAPVEMGGVLYFAASDVDAGTELWHMELACGGGCAEPASLSRAVDIDPGPSSSSPSELTNVNGMLYFRASSAATGSELWKYAGTGIDGPTATVVDLVPGSGGSSPGSS